MSGPCVQAGDVVVMSGALLVAVASMTLIWIVGLWWFTNKKRWGGDTPRHRNMHFPLLDRDGVLRCDVCVGAPLWPCEVFTAIPEDQRPSLDDLLGKR